MVIRIFIASGPIFSTTYGTKKTKSPNNLINFRVSNPSASKNELSVKLTPEFCAALLILENKYKISNQIQWSNGNHGKI